MARRKVKNLSQENGKIKYYSASKLMKVKKVINFPDEK